MPTTPRGLPYPNATDPVASGAENIQALAQAIEPLLPPPTDSDQIPPANPVDGQLWTLPVDTAAGISWTFRYRSASASPFKWELVGGPWQTVTLPGFNALTASGAFLNYGFGILATRAGEYRVRWSASIYQLTAAVGAINANLALGTGSVSPAAAGSVCQHNFSPVGGQINTGYMEALVSPAAAQGIYEIMLVAAGMSVQLGNRNMSVLPVRVS